LIFVSASFTVAQYVAVKQTERATN
jgi:hypothetical protein